MFIGVGSEVGFIVFCILEDFLFYIEVIFFWGRLLMEIFLVLFFFLVNFKEWKRKELWFGVVFSEVLFKIYGFYCGKYFFRVCFSLELICD